ncbi:MAG: winged helix-turn-helix domain-containing protein [Vulcanimicrobiaceae bacterium]
MLQENIAARAVLMSVFSSPNPDHRVTLCTRAAFSLRSGRFAAPNETLTLGAEDLRFDRIEIAHALGKPAEDQLVARVESLTGGWPMAVFLIARLLEQGKLFVLDQAARADDLDTLYDYLAEQIFESLDVEKRDLLTAIALLPEPTLADVKRFTGEENRKVNVRNLTEMAPFVTTEQSGACNVHPLMLAMLRERFSDRKPKLLQRIADAALAEGDVVRAAQVFFAAGDQHAAARALDFGGLYISATMPAVAEIMSAIDADVLVQFPAMWSSATIARALLIEPTQWMREGEFVWRSLTGLEHIAVRAGVAMSLANSYANDGRFADALALCDEFEASLTDEERSLGHAAAELFRGGVSLYAGQAIDGPTYWATVAPLMNDPVTKAFAGYDFVARLHRLNGNRTDERAELERALNLALGTKLPLVIVIIAMDAAFGAWLSREDALFERYMAVLEEHSFASVSNGCRIFIDAVRGKIDDLVTGTEKIKTRAYAYVIAASNAPDLARAKALALQAVAAGDHSAQPFAQVLARVCLATLDPERRSSILEEARAIAAQVASERFRADLDRVIAGQPKRTMWAHLIERLNSRKGGPHGVFLTLNLVEAKVVDVHGDTVALTNREFELLAFLSLGKRAYTTEEIVDAVWADSAKSGFESLKVMISRIRQKSRIHSIVQSSPGGYVATGIRTDLDDLGDLLRSLLQSTSRQEWSSTDIEELVVWWRLLREGFPARVATWPWFGAIGAQYQSELYEVAFLCARTALQVGNFDVALRIADALTAADATDELASKMAAQARAGIAEGASKITSRVATSVS